VPTIARTPDASRALTAEAPASRSITQVPRHADGAGSAWAEIKAAQKKADQTDGATNLMVRSIAVCPEANIAPSPFPDD
jgi:hypothetical protein